MDGKIFSNNLICIGRGNLVVFKCIFYSNVIELFNIGIMFVYFTPFIYLKGNICCSA